MTSVPTSHSQTPSCAACRPKRRSSSLRSRRSRAFLRSVTSMATTPTAQTFPSGPRTGQTWLT